MIHNLRVVGALGARSVRQTLRRPQLMAPLLILPTVLLAIQTGGAGRATMIPGFPDIGDHGFFDFMLAGAMIQSTLLAANSGGIALAVDIEMGFTDRLMAAPISRYSIIFGRLAATAMIGMMTAVWFVVIGYVFGARVEEGLPGILAIIVLVTLCATAFGGIGAAIALRSGSASVVQGMFPLVFVIIFLSSAFFPEGLLLEPARTIASLNPLSWIAEAVRDPVLTAFTGADLAKGLAGLGIVAAIGLALSTLALRRRLRLG